MKVAILGAGNSETEAMLRDGPEREYIGYLDPFVQGWHLGLPVIGDDKDIPALVANGFAFVNIISNSTVARCRASRAVWEAGGDLLRLMHPSVQVDPSLVMGIGTYMQQDTRVQSQVRFGDNCSIHGSCWISHDTVLGHSVQLTFRCNIAGGVQIEDGAYIGAGSTIIPNVTIGKFATVGAGAVVIRDVPEYEIWAGNPAKKIGENPRIFDNGAIRS